MADKAPPSKSPAAHDHAHDHGEEVGFGDDQDLFGNAHLQEELGSAKGGPRAGAPRSKAAALKRHEDNRTLIDKIIRSGLALEPDPTAGYDSRLNLFHNSAQWIDEGEATLTVLSPTHDSQKRPSVAEDQTAYFDTRTAYNQAGATYDDTLDASGNATNDAGIEIERSSVVGSMNGNGVTLSLIDPMQHPEGYIVETLIHEVQHDADQHNAGQVWAVTPGASTSAEPAPAVNYNRFQSEFRAYWLENPEGSSKDTFGKSTDPAGAPVTINALTSWGADAAIGGGDDTMVSATTAFRNKRQEDILTHMGMTAHDADGDWYDYMNSRFNSSYAYVFYYYAVDATFKAMVDAYDTPAVAALDDLDHSYLSDQAASKPLWDQAQAALSAADYTRFQNEVGQAVSGPFIDSYTVVQGDTLYGIADRLLYDASRWQEIYRMNTRVIGDNPSRIKAGTRLVLPAP